jgi:DnaJ-class molecular chaperone
MKTRRPSEYRRRWEQSRREGTFAQRKLQRTEYYFRFVYRWKPIKCGACNGSGHYDNCDSPACSCCDGSGKERVSPADYTWMKAAGLL